jgi:exoribonuclease-2
MPPPHADLLATAEQVMREHGFASEMPRAVVDEGTRAGGRTAPAAEDVRDLRHLPWSSIDNDTSRDLDQLEVAANAAGGATSVRVAIADVDALVPRASTVDRFAADQTTTVYTGVRNFPMLPDALSTGATSLLENVDRLALVVDFVVTPEGRLESGSIYRAVVRNTAQLSYDAVGRWLDGRAPAPPKVTGSRVLQSQLELQHAAASRLRTERHRHGALNIETIETRPIVRNQEVVDLDTQERNGATALIEDFMIAANEVVARFLEGRRRSFIERVVQTPARWDRIVALAAGLGARLPATPDPQALNAFLVRRSHEDPDRFPDLSLAVIKLLGPGEYVLTRPGEHAGGHFGLAIDDYTHSTAPNRRFADLVIQRVLKAELAGGEPPYSDSELSAIAARCTAKANEARKVEREMSKRIAAVVMQRHLGEHFDAVVTGVTPHGTFVRISKPHVEGLLEHAGALDVGDRIGVALVRVDVARGYLDFARR